MSLPPLAPTPRLPPGKKQLQAVAGKASTPPTAPLAPAKAPRRGRGAPATTERLAPFASGALVQGQLPGAPQKSGGHSKHLIEQPQAAAGAAARALSRARPLLDSPGPGLRPPGQSLYAAPRRFSLSLPSEALRVLQRRSLQQPQQRGGAASPGAAKRPLAGGSGAAVGSDWRALLRVSLLNERRRYDDVEYEEEEGGGGGDPGVSPAHEGLVRKCTEWLRGVESAAARDRAEKLETLPHLSTL